MRSRSCISARRPRRRRGGLTLVEVLVSVVILFGALAVLGQLISIGARAALHARLQTRAVLLAESKMSEVIAGAMLLQPASDAPFEDELPHWTWSLGVGPGPYDGLLEVEVTVNHEGPNGRATAAYTLRRLMRDPQLQLDAAMWGMMP